MCFNIITIVLLAVAMPAFAGSDATFDTEKFIKDVEVRSDTRAENIVKNGSNSQDKQKDAAKIVNGAASNTATIPNVQNAKMPIADDKGVNINNILQKYQPEFKQAAEKPRKLNRLLIFISLSMPKESLNQLNIQAEKAGGLLVLRGLVNNSFKDTAAFLNSVSKSGINAVIDPRLFGAFAITTVPTFVVTPSDANPCADSKCKFTPLHDKITGNVTLEYALEQISIRGEVSKNIAKEYLIKLRGNK